MTTGVKASLYAGALETVLAIITFAGGWGPCGPGTPLGTVGLMFHLFPGILVGYGVERLGLPSAVSWAAVVVSQFLVWDLVFLGIFWFGARLRTSRGGGIGEHN